MRAAASLLLLAACDGDPKTCAQRAPIFHQAADDDRVLGFDEAWPAMHDAIRRGVTIDESVAAIAEPADGGTVSVDDWEYAWPTVVTRRGRRILPRSGNLPIRAGWTDRLVSFLSPMGTAHAHGAPITGDVYLLELFIPDAECTVRVLSTTDRWPTDDATRAHVSAQTVVEAELTWAFMDDSVVQVGPMRREARHSVTVEP